MTFAIGLKAIRRLCESQSALEWHRAKLTSALFIGTEKPVFEWVDQHVKTHHALPQTETLESQWPEVKDASTPEPSSYYIGLLENRFFYEVINNANIDSQQILKANQDDHLKAMNVLQRAINIIVQQKYRAKILDVSLQAPQLVLQVYHHTLQTEDIGEFGWPYMDTSTGPLIPGDVVSIVGRPAMGKTYLSLHGAMHNWRKHRNTLFVSMEMSLLPLAQRVTAMYAGTNISQLKIAGYASKTYEKFHKGLMQLAEEEAKLYIVNGNLAASMEDIYALADHLKCRFVVIDGAYLARHKNPRLDRYTRVAENAELIKRYSEDLLCATLASWQFSREFVKKHKKKNEEVGLEDIGYSDVIGQISSIVLGLFQDDGVETMQKRLVRLLKGRDGQIGQFSIKWDFLGMDFSQWFEVEKPADLLYT
jgi:replicative DNA helicase